jgi:hypothetical protein
MAEFLEQLKRNHHAREERGELGRYERMRESAEGLDRALWADWRSGDRWMRGVYEEYDKIRGDKDLSEEGRATREQVAYERGIAQASKGWEAARGRAKQLAKENRERSVPMPQGTLFGSPVANATEIVAIQGEADRIAKKVNGTSLQELSKAVSKNPNDKGIRGGSHATSTLREEFNAACEAGGVEGKIRAHGVLKAAEAMHMPFEDVTQDQRTERHDTAAEQAAQYERYARSIPTVKQIPKPAPMPSEAGQRKVPGDYGRSNKLVLGGRDRKTVFGGKRRPTWK